MEVRGAAKLRLLLTASLLYLVTTYDTDTGGSHLPEPPSGTAAGGGSAATAAARRTLLQPQHPPPRPQGRLPYPSKRHLQQKQQQDGGAAAASGLRCPPLSRELFAGRARNNTVLYAVANEAQWDFFSNWLHHIKRAGIGYYIVAAADTSTSKRLAAAGEPCFDWVDDSIAQHGGWVGRFAAVGVFRFDSRAAIGWMQCMCKYRWVLGWVGRWARLHRWAALQ